jgi:hypothetical protein
MSAATLRHLANDVYASPLSENSTTPAPGSPDFGPSDADKTDHTKASSPGVPFYPSPPTSPKFSAPAPPPAPAPAILFDSDGPLEPGEIDKLIFGEGQKGVDLLQLPDVDEVVDAGKAPEPAKKQPPLLRIVLDEAASPTTAISDVVPQSPDYPNADPVVPDVKVVPATPDGASSSTSSEAGLTPSQTERMKLMYSGGGLKRSAEPAPPPPPAPASVGSIKQPPAKRGRKSPQRKVLYWKHDILPLYKMAVNDKEWTEYSTMTMMLTEIIDKCGSWTDGLEWLLDRLRKNPGSFQDGRILSALAWAGCAAGRRKDVVEKFKEAIGADDDGSERDSQQNIGELARQKMMRWLYRYAMHGSFIQFQPVHQCLFKRNMVPVADEHVDSLLRFFIAKRPFAPTAPHF